MKKILPLAFFLTLPFQQSFAQFTNVMIDNGFFPQEPTISINLLNTSLVAAGSNITNAYYSSDGGATWFSNVLATSFSNAGDPCITADSSGNFFYFHLVNQVDRIVCQKSTDGGVSYNNGSFAWNTNALFQDKEWAVADPGSGNLYVTWTQYDNGNNPGPSDSSRIYFSKSTDGGNSFTPGIRLNKYAGDCLYTDITDPHPFAGINGEIYVTFMDSSGIRFNKSLDTGNTWLNTQPLIDSGGAFRYNFISGVTRIRAMPFSSCDRSTGIHRGNLYVSWADQRNGTDNSDIFFIRSADGGNTWTSPLKVNTDNSNNHQFRNAMAVDQTDGYIYIVYYDRRNYTNNDSTDVYLARSIDGGNSWTDFKISSSGFISDGSVFDGDYIDIAAHAGKARPIWTRIENGNSEIWTALFDEPFSGISNSLNTDKTFSFTINPNPAKDAASISFSREVSKLSVYLYDLTGRCLASFPINNQWDKTFLLQDLMPGVYLVKAEGITRKLVVEK